MDHLFPKVKVSLRKANTPAQKKSKVTEASMAIQNQQNLREKGNLLWEEQTTQNGEHWRKSSIRNKEPK